MIISDVKKKQTMPVVEFHVEHSDDMLKGIAEDLISSVKSGHVDGVVSALKAAFHALDKDEVQEEGGE